jgi:hypothetical protein
MDAKGANISHPKIMPRTALCLEEAHPLLLPLPLPGTASSGWWRGKHKGTSCSKWGLHGPGVDTLMA